MGAVWNTPKRRLTEPCKKRKPRSGGTQYGAEFEVLARNHVGQRAIIIASPLAHYCSALATRPHKNPWRDKNPWRAATPPANRVSALRLRSQAN
jgi:hypothetical protein